MIGLAHSVGRPGFLPVFLVFLVFSTVVAAEDERPACTDCHEVDTDKFAQTVHGFLECVDCHSAAEELPHADNVAKIDCSTCHDDVVSEYATSVHGRSHDSGVSEAPACESCHGPVHDLVPSDDVASPVHHTNLARTCGSCHSNPEIVSKFNIPVVHPLEAFEASVHARVVAENGPGPDCSSCHGSHGILGASDPESMVNHQRVPATCGKCHTEITEVFLQSVHGQAAMHGAREAPVCTDCHGEHRILSPMEPGSPVFASNVPKMTCGRCHGDLRLAEKYGIEMGKVGSYRDSYHGLASRAGAATVANCSSCHGVHDILPSSQPASHVHKDNLAATCGKCHPGAGERFAIGTVHIVNTDREHAAVYWTRSLYIWLIVFTIGGMVVHNLLDLYRKGRSPIEPAPASATSRERLSRGFRAAHALLIVSFAVLVYSGFALTYPESWWAKPLLTWEDSFSFRGWLHRGAAIAMLVALAFHVVHLLTNRRARACIMEMRPRMADVTEFRERFAWYFGRRAEPPKSAWLGYPEKMEYLALMWGIIVMAVTGFVLWFDNLALHWLPKWAIDVATTIHFYEAILASLAILVWHFYFVIFDPIVYPMDTAWLTGKAHPGREHERLDPEYERADGGKPPKLPVETVTARKQSHSSPAARASSSLRADQRT